MTPSTLTRIALAAGLLCSAQLAQAGDCNPEFADAGGTPSFSNLTVPGGVVACAGFFGGNVNSGNAADLMTVQDFLADAAWVGYGLSTTGPIQQVNGSSGVFNFATPLSGLTLVGVHWGNFDGGANPAGNVTAFYLFNAGTALNTLNVSVTRGLSNAAVWAMQPVPEPATWGLMGLGLAALAVRRRPRG